MGLGLYASDCVFEDKVCGWGLPKYALLNCVFFA